MRFTGKVQRCNAERSTGTYSVLHRNSCDLIVLSQIVNFYVVSMREMRGALNDKPSTMVKVMETR